MVRERVAGSNGFETTAAALGEMAERIEKRTQPEELQAMDVPSKSDAVKRA